ncbi:MAG: O-antigen ligase family protein, partial [Candidatus Falkowbacteria bacterium]|nr:O-antigen ligase family protein [Candidatus Falkowbacteria bacterium]
MNTKKSQVDLFKISFFSSIVILIPFLYFFSSIPFIGKAILLVTLGILPLLYIEPFLLWIFLFLFNPSLRIWAKNQMILERYNFNVNALIHVIILLIGTRIIWQHREKLKLIIKKYAFIKTYLLFTGLALISIFYTVSKSVTLEHLIRLSSTLVLFLATMLIIDSKDKFYKLLHVMIIGTIVPSLLGYWQSLTNTGWLDPELRIFRINSTFLHPVTFGGYLALTIPILYSLITDRAKQKLKLNYILASLNNILLIFMTLTRGIWIGLGAMFGLVGIFKNRLLLVVAFFAMIFAYTFIIPIQERIDDIISPRAGSSFENRLTIVRAMIPAIYDAPILGRGFGSFEQVQLDYNEEARNYSSLEAHNDYLRILVELGVIGFILYFGSLVL